MKTFSGDPLLGSEVYLNTVGIFFLLAGVFLCLAATSAARALAAWPDPMVVARARAGGRRSAFDELSS